ncbi:MAG: endonuclease domain-containing protein [Oscillospiraceae bacterium]|nr:endonuclease domain-containing protein [Oscillospiraceae bacterium]
MLPRNKNLKPRSSELRNNATKQENRLWYDFLRKRRPPFYRQRIIGNYIVDFYCPKAKLVIELDGAQHYEDEAMEYDMLRTEYLNSCGLSVLRFSNKEVDACFEGVCQSVERAILSRLR